MRKTIADLLTDVKAKGFWEYGTDRNTGETSVGWWENGGNEDA